MRSFYVICSQAGPVCIHDALIRHSAGRTERRSAFLLWIISKCYQRSLLFNKSTFVSCVIFFKPHFFVALVLKKGSLGVSEQKSVGLSKCESTFAH